MKHATSQIPFRTHILVRLLVTAVFTTALCAGTSLATEHQIAGRYRYRGHKITYRITIPQHPPAAAIVVQYLPPGTTIQKAEPAYSSYDSGTGVAKWLFADVRPGILKITLVLKEKVDRNGIRSEVLFKDSNGTSNTFSLAPMPLKRKAIEGC